MGTKHNPSFSVYPTRISWESSTLFLPNLPGPHGLVGMGPSANIGTLGPGPHVTGAIEMPSARPGDTAPTPLPLTTWANFSWAGVLGVILFWNLGWCLDFKLVTCQSPAIWELGFLWLIKYPLCLGGDIKYPSIFALKYSRLVHEIGLYGASKAHNRVPSWTFDILIFGQWKYYLFNPQSPYLVCWVYLCCYFNDDSARQGEGAQPLGSSRGGLFLTFISKSKRTQRLNFFWSRSPKENVRQHPP